VTLNKKGTEGCQENANRRNRGGGGARERKAVPPVRISFLRVYLLGELTRRAELENSNKVVDPMMKVSRKASKKGGKGAAL